MGALTLKSFPFELRGWDIEKFESIDPTDGFGSNTRVYVSKNRVVQIEPDYNMNTFNTWLTDKGRQFFDSIFKNLKKKNKSRATAKNRSWLKLTNVLTQMLYISKICQKQQNNKQFLIIVFENLSIETTIMLVFLKNKYSFIKLKKAENYKNNNDLESNFQLNLAANKIKLNSSTLCLLISSNPRYEGYCLNLNLRQRFFKGNFKCLIIGSLIDLTFPISFLGSNLNVLKTVVEGNNVRCQELKFSKKPTLVFNQELLKRNDRKNTIKMLKTLKYAGIFNNTWNGLNMLNASLHDVGANCLNQFSHINTKDLNNFSCLYFLNVSANRITNLKKIVDLKLLNYAQSKVKKINTRPFFLDQNSAQNNNLTFYNFNFSLLYKKKIFKNYISLFSKSFYENDDTFINTEGFIKRVNKLILKKKSRSSWQILRKILKYLDKNLVSLQKKGSNVIFFNSKRIANFKNYINYHYQAAYDLTNASFYLAIKNSTFIINKSNLNFKQRRFKLVNTKLNYWLDDFFSGGTDEYSGHSLILANCSKILRSETSNFFCSSGVQQLTEILVKIQSPNVEFLDCLKVYNLILYVAPCALMGVYLGTGSLNITALQVAPYDVTASYLQDLVINTKIDDVNWILRMQSRFENALPQVSMFKDFYFNNVETIVRRAAIMYNYRYQYFNLKI